jgi:thiol-disulfide isomerase/thioredoxin
MLRINSLIVCFFVAFGALAQNGMIRIIEGKLVDSQSGEAVAFATIGIAGSSLGSSSNAEGFFSLHVPANLNTEKLKIKISSIGYENVELVNPLGFKDIRMTPSTTVLKESIIFGSDLTPKGIVKKAFSRIKKNYNTKPFLYKNFYRHYCKEDSAYGRLIEAATEVYKRKGYKLQQPRPGYKDEVRITQLRRSLDKTKVSNTHLPIALYQTLGTDFVGFQTKTTSALSFIIPGEVSILRPYLKQTNFTLEGITEFDGQQVYEISYRINPRDAALNGLYNHVTFSGRLFINTRDYAFVKVETLRESARDTTKTAVLYRKYRDKYYLYHSIKEATQMLTNDGKIVFPHWSHIESITTDIQTEKFEKFKGKNPGREHMLNTPYDSNFWNDYTVLKSTPLEDKIVQDLSDGKSLHEQFAYYDSIERHAFIDPQLNEAAFNEVLKALKGTPVYIDFWASWCGPCIAQMPASKVLNRKYQGKVAFIYLSIDASVDAWKNSMKLLELQDSVMRHHFRIGTRSDAAVLFEIKSIPRYVLVDRNGNFVDLNAKAPSDPDLEKDFERLLAEKRED